MANGVAEVENSPLTTFALVSTHHIRLDCYTLDDQSLQHVAISPQ